MTDTATDLKLSVTRAALLGILNATSGIIRERSPKPILTCVKLSASDGKLTVDASDMEISLRYVTEMCDIDAEGEVCVFADRLREIASECDGESMTIAVVNDRMIVECGDSTFRLYTQKVDEFPIIKDADSDTDFEIPVGDLARMLGQVCFAVYAKDVRWPINGTSFRLVGGRMELAGTDGRRLAISPITIKHLKDVSVVVPSKAMDLIKKLADEPDLIISVSITENRITFSTDHWTLASNLLEGVYPDYSPQIKPPASNKATASALEFSSAIDRAALMSREGASKEGPVSKSIRIELSPLLGVRMSSMSLEKGEGVTNFACKYEGEEIVTGINPVFAMEAIKALGGEEITMDMEGPKKPIIFRTAKYPDALVVVMPISMEERKA